MGLINKMHFYPVAHFYIRTYNYFSVIFDMHSSGSEVEEIKYDYEPEASNRLINFSTIRPSYDTFDFASCFQKF